MFTRQKNIISLSIIFITCFGFMAYALTSVEGRPLKFISGYEMDFNNDNEIDIVFLVETTVGHQLIVLMKTLKGYKTYVISKRTSGMILTCHFGKYVKETDAGKGKRKGRTYETPGTYIQLSLPEGSSVAYFWDGKGFKEVWTSD